MNAEIKEKRCAKCKLVKPLDAFHEDKKSKTHGRVPRCKQCISAAACENRAAKTLQEARWRENNYDKWQATNKARRHKNLAKFNERSRAWSAAHKEKRKAIKKKHWQANRQRWIDYGHQRKARLLKRIVEDFSSTEIFIRDWWICQLCRAPVDRKARWPCPLSASLDHKVPLSAGGHHTRANTQCTHLVCNMKKHNKPITVLSPPQGPS